MTLASLAQLARYGSEGRIVPLRVELARRAEGQDYMRDRFPCPLRFGQALDTMVFPNRALREPMVTARRAPSRC